ncbi:cob(I)yrinic acid a,c-diamide adenosyltransferase [Bacteroides caecigallinarum]|uniref:cob(I)yrinic acid a,c-diamide adenosyltransferase n=1 Tax=Bacteroides caecigallinarum TaxID=1411144 RepID=UPI001F406C2A|nr:cob(I)yrinic acid a,c-diamide adenosyltransferase [Bacteroides caecigallinarum]MCF2592770.1 cob(I)yrinic acid a,c-diamide adenosyltransferase [Bacteroides caecigallinarum]
MRKIYTRTGDEGMTGIHGGERVPKDDIRIEANGCLDELNTLFGIIRSMLPETDEWQEKLYFIQHSMMIVMSHVATPSAIRDRNPNELPQDLDKFCEDWMDEMMSQLEDNGYFILPGGTPLAAQLQNARAVARRAERRLWTLNRTDEVPGEILRFINRLSDLLFVMARFEMQRQQWPEEKWMKFSYKRKKRNDNQQ